MPYCQPCSLAGKLYAGPIGASDSLSMTKWIYGPAEQGSLIYGPWANSNLTPIFANKVLLEHSHVHLFMYFLRLLSC